MGIGPLLAMPDTGNGFQNAYVTRVARSFAHVTGGELPMDMSAPGASAWAGNFALLTHRGDAQAMLNYGNRFVLDLWEMDWDGFTATPSSATAPDEGVEERRRMMATVARDGLVSGYNGHRISRTGRIFMIQDVTIWRLDEPDGGNFGVAAFFTHRTYL